MSAVDTLRDAIYGNPPVAGFEPDRAGVLASFTELQAQVSAFLLQTPSYETVADLPVVTVDDNGKPARVFNDPTPENNVFWIVKSGAWEKDDDLIDTLVSIVQPYVDDAEAARDEAVQAVTGVETSLDQRIEFQTSDDNLFIGRDDEGNAAIVVGIDRLGNHVFKAPLIGDVLQNITFSAFGYNELIIRDDEGNAGLVIRDGKIVGDDTYVKCAPPSITLSPDYLEKSDIAHILIYGQSLSVGADTLYKISADEFEKALMFKGSPRVNLGASISPPQTPIYGSIKPLREFGAETPASGFGQTLALLLEKENDFDFSTSRFRPLISCDGEGGKTITERSPSLTYFENRVKPSIEAAFSLSVAAGKTAHTSTLIDVGGESDTTGNGGANATTYQTGIASVLQGMLDHSEAQTGYEPVGICILSQCANGPQSIDLGSGSAYDVALKQLELCETIENYILACPIGPIPHANGEGGTSLVHLSNRGSYILGAYLALAYKRARFDLHKTLPLVFDTPTQIGPKQIFIPVKYQNQYVLEVDNDLDDPGNNGFSIIRSGSPLVITRAEISGGKGVIIETSLALQSGDEVKYGQVTLDDVNAYGRIRDNSGDFLPLVNLPDGTTWKLHKYAPIQNIGVL